MLLESILKEFHGCSIHPPNAVGVWFSLVADCIREFNFNIFEQNGDTVLKVEAHR